jgi:small subunit ribosomal protein S15
LLPDPLLRLNIPTALLELWDCSLPVKVSSQNRQDNISDFQPRFGSHASEPQAVKARIESMSITKERKTEIISDFRRSDADTGSPEVQIAVLTHRINELTGHLNTHPKDHASRRGLLMLVSRRRGLLNYLRRSNPESYLNIIGRLSLRK